MGVTQSTQSEQPESGVYPLANHLEQLLSPRRLAALAESELLDSEQEEAFDRFTRLASRLLGVPAAAVTLIDDHRQFIKSAVGLGEPMSTTRETPLSHSFCQYAVTSNQALIVMDAREHPWLKHNGAVTEYAVVAYAGIPLVTADEQVLGALCAVDTVPRNWSEEDVRVLRELASMVSTEIELRARIRASKRAEEAGERDRTLLRAVIDCMDDTVFVTDVEGRVVLSNEAARRGRNEESLQSVAAIAKFGLLEADGLTPMSPDRTPAARALRGETVRNMELVRALPGRAPVTVRANATLLRGPSGEALAAVTVGRDVTEIIGAQEALARKEALLRTVVSNLPNGAVLLFGPDLVYQMADGEQLLESMGFTTRDLVGKTVFDIVPMPRAEIIANRYRRTLAGETQEFEVTRDERIYACTVVPVRNAHDFVTGGMAMVYDVTAHKAAERAAREEAASVELLQAIAAAANIARDAHEAFQVCLDRVCQFMDWPLGHVYVMHGNALRSSGWWHSADAARFRDFRETSERMEFGIDEGMIGHVLGSGLATWLTDLEDEQEFRRTDSATASGIKSGFAFPVLIGDEVVAVLEFYSERHEDADLRLLSMMTNIGTQLGRVIERERARKVSDERAEEIRNLSIRDELTGLYNRRGFLELARVQLQVAQREERPALLFFVDLNGMKQINDTLGHDEGDRALVDTAGVLRETFRGSDVVARLGGDEFVALMLDASESQVELFATRIKRAMAERNQRGNRRYRLSASVGGSPFDAAKEESIEQLLVKADALMYEQKRLRRTGQLLSMMPQKPLEELSLPGGGREPRL